MLGIIDWGIGGVSIYKLIKKRRPKTSIIYFSDTGVTPYGKMSRRELIGRLDNVIKYLKSRGMTHLVIGCNAASTALPFLKDHGIPIIGMIESGVSAAMKYRPKKLGLIGGRRTILSGAYRNGFKDAGIEINQRVAQPLSALIESGDLSSEKLHGECERIMQPIRHCSHILLACTHYPAIANILRQHISSSTILVDPAATLVKRVERWPVDNSGKDIYLTTGDAREMKRSAKLAFGVSVNHPKKVSV